MKTSAGRCVARIALGLLFLWAAWGKFEHPQSFLNSLLDYELPLPEGFLRFVAIELPWIEALFGAALLLDRWPETVRPLVCLLCAIFVLVLGQAVVRGLDLSCGCFGALSAEWFDRPGFALARAGLLLALSLYLLLLPANPSDRAA